MMTETILQQRSTKKRLDFVSGLTICGLVHNKTMSIDKIRRLSLHRHAKKSRMVRERSPCNWYMKPVYLLIVIFSCLEIPRLFKNTIHEIFHMCNQQFDKLMSSGTP